MTRSIEIEIINAVECCIQRSDARYIKDALSYQKSFWVITPKGKRQKFYDWPFWLKKTPEHFYFLTGYLKQVLKHCRENNVTVKIKGVSPTSEIRDVWQAELRNITFRPHQEEAIETAITYKRGVIKAPTRTGKTIIQCGVFDSFYVNTLVLAHTVDLVKQLSEEFRRFGFKTYEIHGKKKEMNWTKSKAHVVVITRGTAANLFKKKDNQWMSTYFKMVMVDETHHITTSDGQYAQILKFIKAPLRFGFTATLPDTSEKNFCLTGFIGPLIYELPINDAINQKLLVDPKIRLIKTDTKRIPASVSYSNVYERAIVENDARHTQIAKLSTEYMSQGMSVLILVNKVDHGIYQQYAFKKMGMKVPFVFGDTPSKEREKIKKDLIAKEILCVIVSVVWKEGINIPTLDVCINAAGGVSEILTLQGVGRALTKVEGKEQAIIVDVFDQCHHYLIRHFGERINLYMEQGWL